MEARDINPFSVMLGLEGGRVWDLKGYTRISEHGEFRGEWNYNEMLFTCI